MMLFSSNKGIFYDGYTGLLYDCWNKHNIYLIIILFIYLFNTVIVDQYLKLADTQINVSESLLAEDNWIWNTPAIQ